MSYKYDVIIYWSEEDETFIAQVPDLIGCVADGPTYQAALNALQAAMDEWVETVKRVGRSIPGRSRSAELSHKLNRVVMPPENPNAELVERIITVQPGKRSGQPCIRGMRMTVDDVLGYLAGGMTEEELLYDFPYLTSEDIRACRAFDEVRKIRGVAYRW